MAPILIRASDVDPQTSLWFRMLIATAVLAAFRGPRRPVSSGLRFRLLVASLAFAIDILAFHLAAVRTSVANTAVLAQIAPLIVAPLGYLLFGERQSLGGIVGLLGAFAGTVLLTGSGPSGSLVGNGLAALGGVSCRLSADHERSRRAHRARANGSLELRGDGAGGDAARARRRRTHAAA